MHGEMALGVFPFLCIQGGHEVNSEDKKVILAHKVYEKAASRTIRQTYGSFYLLTAAFGFLAGAFVALKCSNAAWSICISAGALLGFAAGLLTVRCMKKSVGKAEKTERLEGYSDALVEEYIRLCKNARSDTVMKSHALTLASIYNMRGEFSNAVVLLSCFDETKFFTSPSYGHIYYSQLLLAQLMAESLDKATDTYIRGLYYMRTYANSPVSGGYISLSLAVYEFHSGHYDVALQHIADSDRSYAMTPANPRDKLSDENARTVNRYWQARCLVGKGMKKQAADILKSTANAYTTDYYRSKINKLTEELSNEAIP